MVGGGGDALIGPVHRIVARLDDRFELVAGVLSSDSERGRMQAEAIGLPRAYPDVPMMIAAEAQRADGIDAVSIAGPAANRCASRITSAVRSSGARKAYAQRPPPRNVEADYNTG